MSGTEDSLLKRGRNCCAVCRAGRFALLVDGDAYFHAFRRAAERAQRSILILAWDFDSRTPVAWRNEAPALALGDFLNGLARGRRQLQVRVLDWDYPLLFSLDRELRPLHGLGWKPHRRVRIRYDGTHPIAASQHQKIAVIDDRIAFVGGMDLAGRRWDTPQHRPRDPRRVANGRSYPPFHDVMAAVDGEAAAELAEVVRRRWSRATGERLQPVRIDGDPWPEELPAAFREVRVGIACTTPDVAGEGARREVEQLYLDMIARARRYVYLENQYFTARRIGEALAARLAEPGGPEVVLVTRLLSHGWLEELTMHTLRARLVRELRAADRYGRFHVYYPDQPGLPPDQCIDVHSKLMIVDDEWLRLGSANLSNRSMGLDTECDVVLEAAGRPEPAAAIAAARDRLLAEHLDVPAEEVARQIRRSGTIAGAVAALASQGRALKRLEVSEWPDAVVDAIAAPADPERPVSYDVLLEQFAPWSERPSGAALWARALALAAAIAALVLAWRYTPLAELGRAERVVERARDLGGRWWAAPALVAAYTPGSFVFFPRALITLLAVVALGPWFAFPCAMLGNLLAAAVGYAFGRRFRRDTVRRLAGGKLNPLTHALSRSGLLALTALRLVPLGPFTVQNVVAGAIRVRLGRFLLATCLGMLPGTLAATVLGDQLESMLSRQNVDYALLALLALAPVGGAFLVRRAFSPTGAGPAASARAPRAQAPTAAEGA